LVLFLALIGFTCKMDRIVEVGQIPDIAIKSFNSRQKCISLDIACRI